MTFSLYVCCDRIGYSCEFNFYIANTEKLVVITEGV